MIEDHQGGGLLDTFTTYRSYGRNVAADAHARPPYAFKRQYYRGACIFAVDYMDQYGTALQFAWDPSCTGRLEVREDRTPVPLPLPPFYLFR